MNPFHILIVRFSSLGDVVLTTPNLTALKKKWGDKVFISYLTSTQFVPLLQGHRDVDKVYGFSRQGGIKGLFQLREFVLEIQGERPVDLILDLHGTLRSLFLRWVFWKIPRLIVDKRTLERWILTFLKVDFLSGQGPDIQKRKKGYGELLVLRTIRDFAPVFGTSPEEISQDEEGRVTSVGPTFSKEPLNEKKWKLPSLEKGSYICVIPSASFPEKRWPAPRFKNLLRLALKHPQFEDKKFLILAGPDDYFCEIFQELETEFPGMFYNLQGKTNLLESTLFLKNSFFCVGNDTGLPHLAEALGIPSLFILGPTGEEFGFYPHLKTSRVESVSLWCRPCTTNGKGHCIRSERFCLTLIKEESVLANMLSMKKELS